MKWLVVGLIVLLLALSALVGKMAAWHQIALETKQGLAILPPTQFVSEIGFSTSAKETSKNRFSQRTPKQPLVEITITEVSPSVNLTRPTEELSLAAVMPAGQNEAPIQPQEGKWLVLPDSAPRLVRVDIEKQRVYVFDNGQLKSAFKCSTSETGIILPPEVDSDKPHDHTGLFAVQSKELNHFSRKYRLNMPYALRYYGGHYIHATPEIGRLGRPASHGCVRLHPSDAKALYGFIQIGDPIEIR